MLPITQNITSTLSKKEKGKFAGQDKFVWGGDPEEFEPKLLGTKLNLTTIRFIIDKTVPISASNKNPK